MHIGAFRVTVGTISCLSTVELILALLASILTLPHIPWHRKVKPSFSDTPAYLRLQLWHAGILWWSPTEPDMVEIPRELLDCLTDTLAHGP
jgi:hypothetical protein